MPHLTIGLLASRVAVGFAMALMLAPGAGVAQAAPGQQAPDFALLDQDGRSHRLAEHRGRIVVLEWVNPRCPFSLHHARRGTAASLTREHPEAVWLAIDSTAEGHRDHLAPDQVRAHRAEHGLPYPILSDADGRVGRAYGATHTPYIVILDEAGRVLYRGAIDDDPFQRSQSPTSYVASTLRAHAEGRAPQPATTAAYGCSVKLAN